MLSTISVTLYPDSPEIILYGGPSDARGAIVTGRVVVTARSAAQLARLTVTLRPRRARLFQAQQSVAPPAQYQTVLVSAGAAGDQAVHRALGDGAHEWRFSIDTPGALAETIFSRDCFVAYELVACAQAAGAFGTTARSRPYPIAVKRAPPPGSLWTTLASEAICESAAWRGRLELTLVAPSRIIHDQQQLPVRGVIRPLEKGIALRRAEFQIVERIAHSTKTHGSLQPCSEKRVVADNVVELPAARDPPCRTNAALAGHADLALAQETSAERCLAVPPAYTGIQYDIHRELVRASHELVLVVTIADSQHRTHRLRLATPVFVLPRVDDMQRVGLPRYEETGADRLLIASGAGSVRRDSDYWAQFVLVDTADDTAAAPPDTLTACPLALEGYSATDDAHPPPPLYPGAASGIERTVVPAASLLFSQ
ncbi:hypothetical protein LPJ61_000455 [Coemansia biformis]|uniref:Arrestin-like N-terminal domain-containing protein n=1 Tax=Coemansia biformis TaxID=1286918 RepID=A0A9W7YG74_9FUNG|nr:hypothetical protein LPJ61_000455 [Coemansia biformis]